MRTRLSRSRIVSFLRRCWRAVPPRLARSISSRYNSGERDLFPFLLFFFFFFRLPSGVLLQTGLLRHFEEKLEGKKDERFYFEMEVKEKTVYRLLMPVT